MQQRLIILLIMTILVQLGSTQTSDNNDTRSKYLWGIEYSQRFLFHDQNKWNAVIPSGSGLPELGSTVRFHGFRFYVESKNRLCFGFSAYGALSEKNNDKGYTNWEGAMAGFFIDYRIKLLFDLHGNMGLTAGCGRFNFSSMENNGIGINGYTNALLFEPFIGFSYYIADRFIIKLTASTIFSFSRARDWVGTNQNEWVLPKGYILSFTIGSRFL